MAAVLTLNNAPKATGRRIDFSDLDDSVITPAAPTPKKKETKLMCTNTSVAYLARALERTTEPMNPNFARKLKPATKAMLDNIKLVTAQKFDEHAGDPRKTAVMAGQSFASDMQSYITFWKGLLADAAFAAHMDVTRYERSVDADDINESLSGMLPPSDASDRAAFDKAEAIHRGQTREAYAGGDAPEPIATSIEDAVEGIEGLQAWISQAFSAFSVDQAEYWGVDGLCPFGQRKDETPEGTVYTPIRTFDAYRDEQSRLWELKRKAVPINVDVVSAMLES